MNVQLTLKGESHETKELACGRFVGTLYLADVLYHAWISLGVESTQTIRQAWKAGTRYRIWVRLTSNVIHTDKGGSLWVNVEPVAGESAIPECRHPELQF